MNKKSLFALLLVAALLLSGCSLELKDSAVDAKQTILEVNGAHVNKQSFLNSYNYALSMEEYYAQLLASFGGAAQEVDESAILQSTIDSFVSGLVLDQKATELGLDQFTDEDLAELNAQAQQEYDALLEDIQAYYYADTELTGDELKAELASYAASLGYSLETVLASAKSTLISDRLEAYITDGVTITDEDIQATLDAKIADEKDTYASTPAAYGRSANNGSTTYYTPAGYRTISMIEITKPAAEAAEGEEAPAEADDSAERTKAEDMLQQILDGAAIDTLGAEVITRVVCESSTDVDADVVTAAMDLGHAGMAVLVETEESFVLVKYEADVEEKVATLDEARESLTEETLAAAKEEKYNATVNEWIDAAEVKIYTERLSN